MNLENCETFLRLLGIHEYDSNNDWLTFQCPFKQWRHEGGTDNRPSCSMSTKNDNLVNCFACMFKGDALDLLMHLKMLKQKHPYEKLTELIETNFIEQGSVVSLPSRNKPIELHEFSQESLKRMKDKLPSVAREYLRSRGSKKVEYLESCLNLMWDKKDERIVFPLMSSSGAIFGLHGRTIKADRTPKYRVYRDKGHHNSGKVWFGEYWLNLDEPVVIVESVFDALKVYEVYPNVIAPLTASVSGIQIHRLGFVKNIIVIPDQDKAGIFMYGKLKKYVKYDSICSITLPENAKDPSDADLGWLEDKISEKVEDIKKGAFAKWR